MHFTKAQIAALILGYLRREKLDEVADQFLHSSPHFLGNKVKVGKLLITRVGGMQLVDFLKEYGTIYKIVQAKLDETDYFDKKHQSTLVEQLLYLLDIDARSIRSSTPVESDVEATPMSSLPGNYLGKDNETVVEIQSSSSESDDVVVVPENLTQTLLESHELHEKIAQTINSVRNKQTPDEGIEASKELDAVIKTVVQRTEQDPSFNKLLDEIIGTSTETQCSKKFVQYYEYPSDVSPADQRPKSKSPQITKLDLGEVKNDTSVGRIQDDTPPPNNSISASIKNGTNQIQILENICIANPVILNSSACGNVKTYCGMDVPDHNLHVFNTVETTQIQQKGEATTTEANIIDYYNNAAVRSIMEASHNSPPDADNEVVVYNGTLDSFLKNSTTGPVYVNTELPNQYYPVNDILTMPTVIVKEDNKSAAPNQSIEITVLPNAKPTTPILPLLKITRSPLTAKTRSELHATHVRNLDFSSPAVTKTSRSKETWDETLRKLTTDCYDKKPEPNKWRITRENKKNELAKIKNEKEEEKNKEVKPAPKRSPRKRKPKEEIKKDEAKKAKESDESTPTTVKTKRTPARQKESNKRKPKNEKQQKKTNKAESKLEITQKTKPSDKPQDNTILQEPANTAPKPQQDTSAILQEPTKKQIPDQEIINLVTPLKIFPGDFSVPRTPQLEEGEIKTSVECTPFNDVLEAQLIGVDLGSIDTPLPITPGFSLTPGVMMNQRATDYSTSSSYYQPSDTEQNKSLEQLIEECKRLEDQSSSSSSLKHAHKNKDSSPTNKCREQLKRFNTGVVARKNLTLLKEALGSSTDSDSSGSDWGIENRTVIKKNATKARRKTIDEKCPEDVKKPAKTRRKTTDEKIINEIINSVATTETLPTAPKTTENFKSHLEEVRQRTVKKIKNPPEAKKSARKNAKTSQEARRTKQTQKKKSDKCEKHEISGLVKDLTESGDGEESNKLVKDLAERGIHLVPASHKDKTKDEDVFATKTFGEFEIVIHDNKHKTKEYDLSVLARSMQANVFMEDLSEEMTRLIKWTSFESLFSFVPVETAPTPVDDDELMDFALMADVETQSNQTPGKVGKKRKIESPSEENPDSRSKKEKISLLQRVDIDLFLDTLHGK